MDIVLEKAAALAAEFLAGLKERPVAARATLEQLRAALGTPLPDVGLAPERVIEELARAAEPGLIASAGPRYFGFVIGGSLPAALAADWLTSAWDQNAGLYATSPAAAVAEEAASGWLLDVFGLPRSAGVGFVTGCQMANFTCLAAARQAVLSRAGWDVSEDGLQGAPNVSVVIGAEAHVTVLSSLRLLGLGSRSPRIVETDGQGRMRVDALERLLADVDGPLIVCAQAGNVNTGSFDAVAEIARVVHERGGWLHVDAAFGLWAAASPVLSHHTAGIERADSWATDAHKWLNVPYDCGIAIVAEAESQRAALAARASYLVHASGAERDPLEWVPEFSRRARAFTVYAALRSLGRRGVADLVERCCRLARRIADRLREEPGVHILNDVTLNQVLVRFGGSDAEAADALTRAVIARVQQEGHCWLGGTRWQDQEAMRISVSNWSTTDADAERTADAILAAWRAVAPVHT